MTKVRRFAFERALPHFVAGTVRELLFVPENQFTAIQVNALMSRIGPRDRQQVRRPFLAAASRRRREQGSIDADDLLER